MPASYDQFDHFATNSKLAFRLAKQGRVVYGVDLKIVDDAGTELPWDGVAFGDMKDAGTCVRAVMASDLIPITIDLLERSSRPPNFSGSPVSISEWLDDGQHFLQVKGGHLRKVDALTGRSEPFLDPEKMEKALAALPTIGEATAKTLAHLTSFEMNPQRTAALFTHDSDLYYATFDGTQARRLTSSPGDKEGPAFSPDGRFVAFTRDHNLYVVDVATGTERALTSDGSATLSNGRPDWVYEEEIYGRGNPRCFWWSPDSSSLAFLQ